MVLRRMVFAATALLATSALAQDNVGDRLLIELNALETTESACRMSFLVQNGHASDVTSAVFEAVLFDTEGRVDRLTLFDFGTLPAKRPRVRQFVVPQLSCDSLGKVLINGIESCSAVDAASDLCSKGLMLNSRVDAELIG